jgi:hypothetical protein
MPIDQEIVYETARCCNKIVFLAFEQAEIGFQALTYGIFG